LDLIILKAITPKNGKWLLAIAVVGGLTLGVVNLSKRE
jgi:hypothetical protein